MKRRVMGILVAAIAATMLFGCGQATTSETGEVMNSTVTGGGKTQPAENSNEKKSETNDSKAAIDGQQTEDSSKADTAADSSSKTETKTENKTEAKSTSKSTNTTTSSQNNTSVGTSSQPTGTANQTAPAPTTTDNNVAAPAPSEAAPASSSAGSVSHTPPTEMMGDQITKNEAVEEHQDSVESARDDAGKNHFYGHDDSYKEVFDRFFKENQ